MKPFLIGTKNHFLPQPLPFSYYHSIISLGKPYGFYTSHGLECIGYSFADVAHFCIFERCLDSNPECCRSKQMSYQLSHPSPYQYYYYFLPDYESGIRKSLSIYLPYIHVRISWPAQISILCFICNLSILFHFKHPYYYYSHLNSCSKSLPPPQYCITTRILSNPPSSPK